MRQNSGGHAHGDTFGALSQQHRDLGRKNHGFPVAAVVRVLVLGDLRIEEDFSGQGGEPALDVPGGGRLVASVDVAEIPLLLDEQVLVGQQHQRRGDRLIPVRVVPHGLAHHVGYLVELAVVHFEEGVQDAALDRFQTIIDVGDGPVLDHVRGVLDEVVLVELVDISHQTRCSMM